MRPVRGAIWGLVALGCATGGGVPRVAAVASDASVSITASGSAVDVGDVARVTAAAPVNASGYIDTSLQLQWDPADASLDPSSVATQPGWGVEYTTDGSTWSAPLPSPVSAIRGVRTIGVVNSDGVQGTQQVFGARQTSTVTVVTDVGTFTGNSGGDGFDAVRVGDFVVNLWHHSYQMPPPGGGHFNLDCHRASTGDSCGSVYQPTDAAHGDGYTGQWSNLIANGSKVYGAVNVVGSAGLTCTDVSTLPFTSCGYFPLVVPPGGFGPWTGNLVRIGSKIYAPYSEYWNANALGMACFDLATDQLCAGSPWSIPGATGDWPQSVAVGARVYVGSHTASDDLFCFDTASADTCSGWSGGRSLPAAFSTPIPMRSTNGTSIGVCAFSILASGGVVCWLHDGTSVDAPAGLLAALAAYPMNGFYADRNMTIFGSTATKQLWQVNRPGQSTTAMCYDWVTDAICSAFVASQPDVAPAQAVPVYTITVTSDGACAYTASDTGQISLFNIDTGLTGCADPGMHTAVPQSSAATCAAGGQQAAWTTLQIVPVSGADPTSYLVTIEDSAGVAIPGWVDVVPPANGVIDISSLAFTDTGTTPTVVVVPTGAANGDVIGATMFYATAAPSLCVDLVVRSACSLGGGTPPSMAVDGLVDVGGVGGSAMANIARVTNPECGTATTTAPPTSSANPTTSVVGPGTTTSVVGPGTTTPPDVPSSSVPGGDVGGSGVSLPETGTSAVPAAAGVLFVGIGLLLTWPGRRARAGRAGDGRREPADTSRQQPRSASRSRLRAYRARF